MARERLVLIAFGVALLTATNCSQDVATESLAGGFPPGEMGFGNPPEESFRAVMSDWNMAGRDIDCMVREMFPSSTDKTVTRSTRFQMSMIQQSELTETAARCNVDFSRMRRRIGD